MTLATFSAKELSQVINIYLLSSALSSTEIPTLDQAERKSAISLEKVHFSAFADF